MVKRYVNVNAVLTTNLSSNKTEITVLIGACRKLNTKEPKLRVTTMRPQEIDGWCV